MLLTWSSESLSCAHPLGYPLDLPGARAHRIHLGHSGYVRPVHPLVVLEDVVGEEACAPEPGDFEVQCSHTGVERPRTLCVPTVATGRAYLLRLHVHHGAHHHLGKLVEELLEVD